MRTTQLFAALTALTVSVLALPFPQTGNQAPDHLDSARPTNGGESYMIPRAPKDLHHGLDELAGEQSTGDESYMIPRDSHHGLDELAVDPPSPATEDLDDSDDQPDTGGESYMIPRGLLADLVAKDNIPKDEDLDGVNAVNAIHVSRSGELKGQQD